jgi:hypothetical protein
MAGMTMDMNITLEDNDHLRETMNYTDPDPDQYQLTDQTTKIDKTGPDPNVIKQELTQGVFVIKALTDLDKDRGQTQDQDIFLNKPTR